MKTRNQSKRVNKGIKKIKVGKKDGCPWITEEEVIIAEILDRFSVT